MGGVDVGDDRGGGGRGDSGLAGLAEKVCARGGGRGEEEGGGA